MPRAVSNLPAELTSFVGRRAEITAIRRLLSTARLVTLAGPGGVGKTRLALRVAAESRSGYPGGVWFVPLAAVRAPALVAQTVAQAVGIQPQGPGEPVALLVEFLR